MIFSCVLYAQLIGFFLGIDTAIHAEHWVQRTLMHLFFFGTLPLIEVTLCRCCIVVRMAGNTFVALAGASYAFDVFLRSHLIEHDTY